MRTMESKNEPINMSNRIGVSACHNNWSPNQKHGLASAENPECKELMYKFNLIRRLQEKRRNLCQEVIGHKRTTKEHLSQAKKQKIVTYESSDDSDDDYDYEFEKQERVPYQLPSENIDVHDLYDLQHMLNLAEENHMKADVMLIEKADEPSVTLLTSFSCLNVSPSNSTSLAKPEDVQTLADTDSGTYSGGENGSLFIHAYIVDGYLLNEVPPGVEQKDEAMWFY